MTKGVAILVVTTMVMLEEGIRHWQKQAWWQIDDWKHKHRLQQGSNGTWYKGKALVVVEDESHQKALLRQYHDAPTAGHAGTNKTIQAIMRDYWWPNMKGFVWEYVQGCAQCQQSKMITYLNCPPLQPIPPNPQAQPFSTITMDFIIKLPTLNGCDLILTMMDYDCTKAVILLPCQESMSLLDVAKTYLEQGFPFVGLLEWVISDQDPKFTLRVFREVYNLLKVK